MSAENQDPRKMRFQWSKLCSEKNLSGSDRVAMLRTIAAGKDSEDKELIATHLIKEILSGKYDRK